MHSREHVQALAAMVEAIAWQRWEVDRIAEERFYYEPARTLPNAA